MKTKFSKSVPASVGASSRSDGSVSVDTFMFFSEVFLELHGCVTPCVGLTTDQAEELGEALIEAARYRREADAE